MASSSESSGSAPQNRPSLNTLMSRKERDHQLRKLGIMNVWANNFPSEFNNMIALSREADVRCISIDTEFPGNPADYDPSCKEYARRGDREYDHIYQHTICSKVLQIGFTFADADFQVYSSDTGIHTYQFNFDFSLRDKSTMYSQKSIEFLRKGGKGKHLMSLHEFRQNGIKHEAFRTMVQNYPNCLLGNPKFTWVLFQGARDLAYLLQTFLGVNPPPQRIDFLKLLKSYFYNLYDVKYMVAETDYALESLGFIAEKFMLQQCGQAHSAGGDAMMTLEVFCSIFTNDKEETLEKAGYLYFVGNIHSPEDRVTHFFNTYAQHTDESVSNFIISSDSDTSPYKPGWLTEQSTTSGATASNRIHLQINLDPNTQPNEKCCVLIQKFEERKRDANAHLVLEELLWEQANAHQHNNDTKALDVISADGIVYLNQLIEYYKEMEDRENYIEYLGKLQNFHQKYCPWQKLHTPPDLSQGGSSNVTSSQSTPPLLVFPQPTFSPSIPRPDVSTQQGFSQSAPSPGAYPQQVFSQSTPSPGAYPRQVVSQSTPSQGPFLPHAFTPSGRSPATFLPHAFTPSSRSPATFLPHAFTPLTPSPATVPSHPFTPLAPLPATVPSHPFTPLAPLPATVPSHPFTPLGPPRTTFPPHTFSPSTPQPRGFSQQALPSSTPQSGRLPQQAFSQSTQSPATFPLHSSSPPTQSPGIFPQQALPSSTPQSGRLPQQAFSPSTPQSGRSPQKALPSSTPQSGRLPQQTFSPSTPQSGLLPQQATQHDFSPKTTTPQELSNFIVKSCDPGDGSGFTLYLVPNFVPSAVDENDSEPGESSTSESASGGPSSSASSARGGDRGRSGSRGARGSDSRGRTSSGSRGGAQGYDRYGGSGSRGGAQGYDRYGGSGSRGGAQGYDRHGGSGSRGGARGYGRGFGASRGQADDVPNWRQQ